MKIYRTFAWLMIGATISALLLSACNPLQSPDATAGLPEDAIVVAVQDYLAQQGNLFEQAEVRIEQRMGDFARAQIISTDVTQPGGLTAFLKRVDGQWQVLIAGSGFDPAEVQALGIPESILPEGWFYPSGKLAAKIQPQLSLSDADVAPGQEITIAGTGFASSTPLVIRMGTLDTGLDQEDLAQMTTLDDGSFQVAVAIPRFWPGTRSAVIEPDLILAAVDLEQNNALALASLTNTAAASNAGVCLEPGSETLSWVDEAVGYCLLYPVSHTVFELDSGNTEIVVGQVMNHIDPRISITSEAMAGRTLAQAVDDFLAGFPGFEIVRGDLTVDNQQAILLDGIPGQDFYRKIFVAHDGKLYQLSFAPYDPNLESIAQAEQLYALAMNSFRFTSP